MQLFNYLIWSLAHFLVWTLMLLAAFSLGNLAALFVRPPQYQSLLERVTFTLALGLGLWALLIFALGSVGAIYAPLLWLLTIILAFRQVLSALSRLRQIKFEGMREWLKKLRSATAVPGWLFVVVLGYLAIPLRLTQYPPIQWDAIGNHLVVAREYLLAHRLAIYPSLPQPVLPALNHLLFTWAMALLDDLVAQLIEFTFLLLTAVGLYLWGRRENRELMGLAAGALWLAHPLVLQLGTIAYIDVALTCYVFLGLYALRVFAEKRAEQWLVLAVALLGMAAGTKITGLFFLGLGTLVGLWLAWRARLGWAVLAKACVLGCLVVAPWYGLIAYHTGNPVFPFFPQWSRSPWNEGADTATVGAFFSGAGGEKNWLKFFKLPYDLMMRQGLFFKDDNRGYWGIIALWPVALLAVIWRRSEWWRAARWWAGWTLAYTLFWYATASYLRYLLPVVPLMGLALYESIDCGLQGARQSETRRRMFWLTMTLAVLLVSVPLIARSGRGLGRTPPTSAAARQTYLNQIGYRGVEYLNQHAQADDKVWILDGNYITYYLKPRVVGHAWTGVGTNGNSLTWPADKRWLKKVEAQNVSWVIILHAGQAPPQGSLFPGPDSPRFEMVFSDERSYVYRRVIGQAY